MITFLKLGGSVITDKSGDKAARPRTIDRIASEIAEHIQELPSSRLLLGHGSGSFGHTVAAEHGTHLGAQSERDWMGFAAVWHAARELNTMLVEALISHGLPAIAFPPSASAISRDGKLISMANEPIKRALEVGLLPVVYGDVVFDQTRGSSIASTEEVFIQLAQSIKPGRLLLAGRAEGVYDVAGPEPELLEEITPEIRKNLIFDSPDGEDVTGGMAAKVDLCLDLAKTDPELEILIFSAEQPGQLRNVLAGKREGTLIRV
jgi:isopentenyl phosphate kinase